MGRWICCSRRRSRAGITSGENFAGLVAFVFPLVAVPVASNFCSSRTTVFRWLAGRDTQLSMDRVSRSADHDAGDADYRLRVCGDSGDADVASLPNDGAGGDEQRWDHRGGLRRDGVVRVFDAG